VAARVRAAGDAALVVEFPARLDLHTSEQVIALGDAVRREWAGRVRDVVVGFHTLTVYFDPLLIDGAALETRLKTLAGETRAAGVTGAEIEVPVCYGGAFGPDLDHVATAIGATAEEVIALHSLREYRVFVVGFVPGFAYMGTIDDRLSALRRRPSPRTRVPAGSVAIASGQTGIYPMETPGGWHLLGRTPVRPYDPARAPAVLFRPGDRVRFVPIERAEFEAMVS
jgi:KipI family sensor histidine kinase inhibitor